MSEPDASVVTLRPWTSFPEMPSSDSSLLVQICWLLQIDPHPVTSASLVVSRENENHVEAVVVADGVEHRVTPTPTVRRAVAQRLLGPPYWWEPV